MPPFGKYVLNEIEHLRSFGLSTAPLFTEYDKFLLAANATGSGSNSSFSLPVPYTKRGDRALAISATLGAERRKRKDKIKCGFLSRGFYAEQLAVWMRYFPLHENKLKVVRYEAFLENRTAVLREVLDFVGAPAMSFEDLDLEKSYSPERPGPPFQGNLTDYVRGYLARFYKPYNDELADLLGEDWRDVWD